MPKNFLLGLLSLFFSILSFYGVFTFFSTRQKFLSSIPKFFSSNSLFVDAITPSASPFPKTGERNNLEVKKIDLLSLNIPTIPKRKLSSLSQAFLTKERFPKDTSPKSTQFQPDEEIFLVLESLEDSTQMLDIFLQKVGDSEFNVEYKVLMKKGFGFLSLGTNFSPGQYRLILTDNQKKVEGYFIQFSVQK